MADEGIPNQVKQFIDRFITSVEQLEILLLLCKDPSIEFTVQSAYDIILSSKHSVETWLEYFVQKDLAKRLKGPPAAYQLRPPNVEGLAIIAALDKAYRAMPVRVIEAIYNKESTTGVDPAQGFADAFRLRKD